MPKFKIDKLNKIEFIWDPIEKQWEDNYEQLKEFFIKEGHTNIPYKDNLGAWLSRQRLLYRKENLPTEKIDKLEKLKIKWDVFEERWQENYQELKMYFEEKGNTNVPANQSVLGSWVRTQRQDYKTKKLPQDKIYLLEKINFQWTIYN